MDTPLLKYLERHQKKLRFMILVYLVIFLIEKIAFGPIAIDAFIKTGHLYSAVLVLMSIITSMCGIYGYIKLNRYCCIYFLTYFIIEKITGVIHDFVMMHQNYKLFSTNALQSFLVDVYAGLVLSLIILVIGTLLLYFDFMKDKASKEPIEIAS